MVVSSLRVINLKYGISELESTALCAFLFPDRGATAKLEYHGKRRLGKCRVFCYAMDGAPTVG